MKGVLKYIIATITVCILCFKVSYGQGSISPSSASVCVNGTVQFTVSGSAATGGYTWTVGSGGTITAGHGTRTITVQFSSGMGIPVQVSGNGLSAMAFGSVYFPPGQPGPISGPSTVCPGATSTFSIPSMSNVTQISWVATNANIVSQNGTSVTVSFPASYTSGQIIAYGINGPCGAGPSTSKSITAGAAMPATPGPISGTSAVAPGQTGVAYSVGTIANATSYQWSLPTGASIASGSGTQNITVNFSSSFTGGSISVNGSNSSCSGPSSAPFPLTLSTLPGAPGPISGNNAFCEGGTVTATYSIQPIPNATSYQWIPGGGPISPVGSLTGTSVTISFPADPAYPGMNLTVRGINSAGSGPVSTINFTIYRKPGTPGPITGPINVCRGQKGVTYSVPPISNASPHIWVAPPGATIVSGHNTNSITVDFSDAFTTGDFRVFGVNGPCGSGPHSLLTVNGALPNAAGPISGSQSACPSASATYSIPVISNATGYVWTVPPGATITSGQNTNKIVVSYPASPSGGTISVYGTNCSGNGTPSSLPIAVGQVPGAAGPISGTNSFCETGLTTTSDFSVQPIPHATSYQWIPGGGPMSFVGSTSGTTVTLSFPASTAYPGMNLTVRGVNSCGTGAPSGTNITILNRPGNPGTITGLSEIRQGQSGVEYSVPTIPHVNAGGYQWTVPAGVAIVSGQGTPNLKVNFTSSFTSGTITVTGQNICGSSVSPSSKTVSVNALAVGPITGGDLCMNKTDDGIVTYSVTPVPGATSYSWSFTGGVIPLGDLSQGGYPLGSVMTIKYPVGTAPTSATISVFARKDQLSGPPSSITTNVYKQPASGGPIQGPSTVCPSQVGVSYNVSVIENATSYVWSLPQGATVTGADYHRTLTFPSNFTGGQISVRALNGPCTGPLSILTVSTPPAVTALGAISGYATVCAGLQGATYSVPPIPSNLQYVWTPPGGCTIVSGQGTNTITVDYTSAFNGGTMRVSTSNGCATGAASTLNITRNASATLPTISVHPTSNTWISGMPNVTFSVTATGTGLSYQWRKNKSIIPGATASTYQLTNVQIGDEANYDVVVSSATGCSVISNTARLTVKLQLDRNYIISRSVFRDGLTNEDEVHGLPVEDLQMSVTYYDGLGRAEQQVDWKASPQKRDVVTPFVYNDLGLEILKYLPYVPDESNGQYKSVSFNTNKDYAHNFYGDPSDKIADDDRPFTETVIETSPLHRPLKKYGPGKDWYDNAKYTGMSYLVNIDGTSSGQEKIIAWKVNSSGLPIRNTTVSGASSGAGYYATGKLSIRSVTDENGNETREYLDYSERVILKKSYLKGTKTNLSTPGNWVETYYIYDDLNNLRYVLQPELVKTLSESTTANPTATQLSNFAFQYKYDERRRLIEKKIPGAEPVYMVYNNNNQLVLTQTGNQRKDASGAITKTEWSFTKYDAFGRVIMTGLYTHGSVATGTSMSGLVNSSSYKQFETYNGNQSTHGYSNSAFPTLNLNVLTVMYYDNYEFKSLLNNSEFDYRNTELTDVNPSLGKDKQEAKEFLRVNGQVTGMKIGQVGANNSFLWTVNYYDNKLRTIQTTSFLDLSGSIERITNRYDFSKLCESKTFHKKSMGASHTVYRRITYDHVGRPVKKWHKFDAEAEVLLTNNEYNELGQLTAAKLHSRNSGTSFAQSVDYLFNIRGWMESVNDMGTRDEKDLFSLRLNYNKPSSSGGAARYNGMLSEIQWTGAGSSKQSYAYSYDNLNRMTTAKYYEAYHPLRNGKFDESVGNPSANIEGYDLNGNIKRLFRNGENNATTSDAMDDLTYTYTGNQLTRVDDAIALDPQEGGFKENVEAANEYAYDWNGNIIKDDNKGITSITYNHMNLPALVYKGANHFIIYTYDALGRKLRQQVQITGSVPTYTDYLGEYIYQSDALQFVNHDEGRLIPGAQGAEYQYHLKDHLGNVRLTFSEKTTTTTFMATMERLPVDVDANENNQFNMVTSKKVAFYNHTPGTGKEYSYRLSGSPGEVVGPARSFAVNPGDAFDLEVYARYNAPTSTGSGISGFLSALIGAFKLNPAGTGPIDGAQAHNTFSSLFSGGAWITPADYEDTGAPKAFINYLLFDENFNLEDAGFDQVTQVGASGHDYLDLHVKVKKKGFLYVYLSNENDKIADVYFDDFKITHHTAVEQSNDYYPFGLTFNSFQKANSKTNSYLYNGKELQDEFDLGWYDFGARMYMTDIGRWGVIDPLADKYVNTSPYVYALNNPVNFIDPKGMDVVGPTGETLDEYFERNQREFEAWNAQHGPSGEGFATPPGLPDPPEKREENENKKKNKKNEQKTEADCGCPDPPCDKSNDDDDGTVKAAVATAAAFSIADGPIPVGEIIGIGIIAYAIVHANNKNSQKPNIVYEIYKYNSITGYQTMKYGISSRADFVTRSGNPRPEYQVVALNISQPFHDNSFYGYTILARTPDRSSALAMEKQLVEAYMLSHGGFRPPLQIRP